MKKKDPVLWVVVDRDDQAWSPWPRRTDAADSAKRLNMGVPELAPFRVVKYIPAPKPKKRKNAK